MNEALIERWNSVVTPQDTVYHLGDVALGSSKGLAQLLNRLNGNICLIKGNHEKAVMGNKFCRDRFGWIKDYYRLKVQDEDAPRGVQDIVLCHYPMRSWEKAFHGSWMLFGHVHGKYDNDPWGLSMDAGVDSNNYYPFSYEDVKSILSQREWK